MLEKSQEMLLKEAYKLRYEYFNAFENKEFKWHEVYKNHELYEVVVKSFEYNFKEIAAVMPKLIERLSFK